VLACEKRVCLLPEIAATQTEGEISSAGQQKECANPSGSFVLSMRSGQDKTEQRGEHHAYLARWRIASCIESPFGLACYFRQIDGDAAHLGAGGEPLGRRPANTRSAQQTIET